MGTEIELKLGLAEGDAVRLLEHPLVRTPSGRRPATRRLSSVYFDTPELDLLHRGVALRVRRSGGRRVQTVKAEADPTAAGGVHARGEWEAAIEGDEPDPARITEPRLRALLDGADGLAGRLRPLFSAEIGRTVRRLRLADGTGVELALDIGEIKDGAARLAVCEAELELKAGRAAGLYLLALRLHQDVPLVIETETKAGRGYALAAGLAPGPRKAGEVRLAPEMAARDAFRAVARDCVAQILGSQACALRGEDPEGVHQMRVGLRRLRSALGSFRDHLPADRRRAFNGELRWLGERLGRVRDLDVFDTETLPGGLGERLDAATRAALERAAGAARAEAQAGLRGVLRSPRHTALMLKLLAWIEDDDGGAAAPVGGAARDILRRHHRSVAKLGRRLHRLDDAERHELRKRAKKLRYAAEFFQSLCPDKPHRRYVRALKGLQEGLGAMNDAAVARRLLAELAGLAGLPAEGVVGSDGGPPLPETRPAGLKKPWATFAGQRPLHKVCGGAPAGGGDGG